MVTAAETGKKAARTASKLATGTTHLRDVFNTVSGKLNRAGNRPVASISQRGMGELAQSKKRPAEC